MLTLVLLLIFLLVAVLTWFQGLWNNVITLINVIISALLASNFYEPLARSIDKSAHSYTYLLDFLLVWGIFALSMTILRIISEFASNDRVAFIMPVEMAGRTILALWIAWMFVSFTAMTLHTAPVQANSFNGAYSGGPDASTFVGTTPERFWLGFVRSRSTGVFANGREFDAEQFRPKYYKRRQNFEGESAFLIR